MMAVRPYGRVILMGGVGMPGGPGLELSYAWIMRNCVTIHGVWMYPRHAPGGAGEANPLRPAARRQRQTTIFGS